MDPDSESKTFGSNRFMTAKEISARQRPLKEALRCPHCNERLQKWRVPDSPFNEWSSEFQHICFNDACDYFVQGWATMSAQGAFGTYRFMYDPSTDACYPIAVLSRDALKDGIVLDGQ